MVCKYSVYGWESLVVISETDIQESVECILGSRQCSWQTSLWKFERATNGSKFFTYMYLIFFFFT